MKTLTKLALGAASLAGLIGASAPAMAQDAPEFALTGLAAVLVCLLITIYPALLASRLRPVDALRYE